MDTTKTSEKRPRWRRWLIVGLAVVVLMAGGWQGVKWIVRVERYLPMLTGLVERYTGLPATVGGATLRLLPSPRLAAWDLAVGADDFQATAARVDVQVDVFGLLRRRVNVTGVQVRDVKVVLPESNDALLERIKAVRAHFPGKSDDADAEARTPATGGERDALHVAGFAIRVAEVRAREVTVRRGDVVWLRGDAVARDVLASRIPAEVDAVLPFLRGDATLRAAVTTDLSGASPRIDGAAFLRQLDIENLAGDPRIPHTRITLDAKVQGVVSEEITVELSGEMRTAVSDAFSGRIGAMAGYRGGVLTVRGARLDSAGLEALAEAEIAAETMTFRVLKATASGEGLRVLLAMVPIAGVRLVPRPDARFAITDFHIGALPSGTLGLLSGDIALDGIDLALQDGPVAFPAMTGRIGVKDNAFHIQALKSEGFEIRGEISPDLDAMTAAVKLSGEAELSREKLAMFLPLDSVKRLSGGMTLKRLSGVFGAGRPMPPKDLVAEATLRNVSGAIILPERAAPLEIEQLQGGVAFREGAVHLEELKAQGIGVNGKLRPDLKTGAVAVDLSADLDLAASLVQAFLPEDMISGVAGTLSCKRIAATIIPGEGLPKDLLIEGAVRDGRATLKTPAFTDHFSGIAATFTSDLQRVNAKISMTSETMGALQFEGQYALADQSVHGVLSADIARAARPFLPEGAATEYGLPVLSAYGASRFDVEVRLPQPGAPEGFVHAVRQGSPALDARVNLALKDDAIAPATVQARASFPTAAVAKALPAQVSAEGPVNVEASVDFSAQSFQATAVLNDAVLRVGDFVHKRKGVPLQVQARGGSPQQPFAPQSARIGINGEQIDVDLRGDAPRIPELDLNLQPLSALLVEGASMRGRVRGSVDLAPVALSLQLDNAGVTLSPEVAIESVTGLVSYRPDTIQLDHVHIRGADSDCTINAATHDGMWHATVEGPKLNMNAVETIYQAVATMLAEKNGAGTDSAQPREASGEMTVSAPGAMPGKARVQLQSVYYRRGRMDDVRADIDVTPEGIRISNLTFRPYAGQVTGQAEMVYGKGGAPATIVTNLNLNAMDLRFLDDVAFEQPRGISGLASGVVDMRLPAASGMPLYQGLNGTIDITAEKGGLGKLGYATKILAVLRTTEILRLSLPSLCDDGLTFRTARLKLDTTGGNIRVQDVALIEKSYALVGSGLVNLPGNSMDVDIGFNVLESVTGIVDRVPIVGDTVGMLREGMGFRIRMRGSPFDPNIRLDAGIVPIRREERREGMVGAVVDGVGAVVDSVTSPVVGGVTSVVGGVVSGVVGGVHGALGRNRRTQETAEEAPPEGEAAPEESALEEAPTPEPPAESAPAPASP